MKFQEGSGFWSLAFQRFHRFLVSTGLPGTGSTHAHAHTHAHVLTRRSTDSLQDRSEENRFSTRTACWRSPPWCVLRGHCKLVVCCRGTFQDFPEPNGRTSVVGDSWLSGVSPWSFFLGLRFQNVGWEPTGHLEKEDLNDGADDSVQMTTGLGHNGRKKDGESWIQSITLGLKFFSRGYIFPTCPL